MNDVAWFVAKIRSLGFKLRVDPVGHPGKLGITRPAGFVDATLDSLLAEYKSRIVAYLESEQSPTDEPADNGPDGTDDLNTSDDLWPERDPAAGAPRGCDKCGNILFRQDVAGTWHCQNCEPGQSERLLELADRIRGNRPPREPRPWQRLVGAGFPPRPRPQVDPQTIAEPVPVCSRCQRERVVGGVLGSLDGICFYCWMQGRN